MDNFIYVLDSVYILQVTLDVTAYGKSFMEQKHSRKFIL
jgi:hypothetical protein